jgi:hypothetical protein
MVEYKASLVKEQERRRMAGLTHPFEMHEFSRSISQWALERALKVAQNDAHEALLDTTPSSCTPPHHIKIVNTQEECPSSVSLPPRHCGSLALLHPSKKIAVATPNSAWMKPKAVAHYVENNPQQKTGRQSIFAVLP